MHVRNAGGHEVIVRTIGAGLYQLGFAFVE